MTFTITAYCACSLCCGHWASLPPSQRPVLIEGVTCAAPHNIRKGTKVAVTGLGEYIVTDRPRRGLRVIDLYMKDHEKAKQFGKRKLSVTFIKQP